MDFKIEDITPVKKIITFEIPADEVSKEFDEYYTEISKTAERKGFRKGKVPKDVLEQEFAEDAKSQVINILIQQNFWKIMKEHEFKIVCDPSIDAPDKNVERGKSFTFTATIEIAPIMDDIDFKGLELTKYKVDITDDDINIQLNQLQKTYAENVPAADDYAANEGDSVDVTYQAYDKDGNALTAGLSAAGKDRKLKLGENAILSDIDKALVGVKKGETKKIEVRFPNDYYHRTLADQNVTYELTVNGIEQSVLPTIDDELAKKTGVAENLGELKNKIREELAKRIEIQNERGMYEQMFEQLAEKFTGELPEGLVEMKLDGIYEEMKTAFEQQELNFDMMGITRESMVERYKPTAEKQARFHLVAGKIIEQEKVSVSREDLSEGYAELARDLGVPKSQVEVYYAENPEDQVAIRNGIMERKVFKMIIDNAKVVEKEPPTAEEVADARANAMQKDMANIEKNIKAEMGEDK